MNNKYTHRDLDRVLQAAGKIIVGKDYQIRQTLAGLLARGHILIEDLPGVGKTTLAHTLARLLGMDFSRIQFTSDMMPADIIGVSVFDRSTHQFQFHPGPVFSQIILADEVNRATPKAQSALLEAMEEQQVTIDGVTHPLPKPFFVIATQNPSYQVGTFPLPESQLDRFLLRIELGYPNAAAEMELLAGKDRRELLRVLEPQLAPNALVQMQNDVQCIHISTPLISYVQALCGYTRMSPKWEMGLSPRAALGLVAGARAWAFLDGRNHVLPEDVQAILPAVASHRLRSKGDASAHIASADVKKELIEAVPLP